jgi:hypothetical protein
MSDESESEILSYREFKNREALLAWEQRRRAFEARGPASLVVGAHVQKQNDRNRYTEQPKQNPASHVISFRS